MVAVSAIAMRHGIVHRSPARPIPSLLLCASAVTFSFVAAIAPCHGAEPFHAPTLTVPDGYRVELAAGPPLVAHPMMACFDDRGRLFVAESAGRNVDREELEKTLPNFVRLLEDTDGDGRFDRSGVFADCMTLPMGGLWLDGSLLVASPPYIWRLTDTDDDGRADRREVLVGQFGYTGNAASIHGPFLGPDGRIYWCDGRHGHRILDASGEVRTEGQAARIFSCRPDGSDVEVVCGGGMDNPVEVDFTPEGEMLGTVNLFYRKRGDCLVHWVEGGAYPRYDQQSVVAELKRTGDLLPPVLDLGHVAVSGTVRYRSRLFFGPQSAERQSAAIGLDASDVSFTASAGNGPPQRFPYFVAEFNTHKVICIWVERNGATFTARSEDFLVSSSADFHPTDVLEDADGSLLVIDTGGWFRIGCPTSQVAKPDVHGAIYRVRREDRAALDDPRGERLDWSRLTARELSARLDDPRPAVRDRAITGLARLGERSMEPLGQVLEKGAVTARRNAVWTLCRIGSPAAVRMLTAAIDDPSESVRLAAARSLSALRQSAPAARWADRLNRDTPAVRRELATALGRSRSQDAVPLLLESLADGPERMLEHAILHALIEIGDPQLTSIGLSDPSPAVQRGALIALDQMKSDRLTGEVVATLADSVDAPLRDAALDVLSRHPEWSAQLAGRIRHMLRQKQTDPAGVALLRGGIVSLAWDEELQALAAAAVTDPQTPEALRHGLLAALAAHRPKPLSNLLRDAVGDSLFGDDQQGAALALSVLTAWGQRAQGQRIEEIALDVSRPIGLRLSACESLARLSLPLKQDLVALISQHCRGDVDPAERLTAARALALAPLSDEQRRGVLTLVAGAGPLELPLLIAVFEPRAALESNEASSDQDRAGRSSGNAGQASFDAALGLALVEALERSAAVESLPPERITGVIDAYPDPVRRAAAGLLARLGSVAADQVLKLREVESRLAEGDAERGAHVFFGAKAACGACHRVETRGGDIGPDLTQIGRSRSRRDLLEAIVLPSASMARGFEAYQVITRQGITLAGVIARDDPESFVFRTGDRREVRVARDEIEELAPSPVSIMPQGLEQLLSSDELSDLIAFLSRGGVD
jgi:putative membrane-bound dehydrogenase-like protein